MTGSLGMFNGMPLYENRFLHDRIVDKMCKSKKKRQVKKWLKNDAHYKNVPSQKVWVMGNQFHIHPGIKERFMNAIRNQEPNK